MNLLKKDWFYTHPSLPTPISVTHESLKIGSTHLKTRQAKPKHRGDFYPRIKTEEDYNSVLDEFNISIKEQGYSVSSYRRDYDTHYTSKCPPKASLEIDVDPLFNRRPVNDFYMLPWASGKFMDDHISSPSEARKRINFFRQIREKSYFDSIMNEEPSKEKIKENNSGE